MRNKVMGMVATLGLVLTVGVLATIYSQQAFGLVVTGGNGGDCTILCNGNQGGTGTNGGIGTSGANANGGPVMSLNGQSHHVTGGHFH